MVASNVLLLLELSYLTQLLVMDGHQCTDYYRKAVVSKLQEWATGHAVFSSHRLSSIKNSDLILVMHNGELVEQGNHQN